MGKGKEEERVECLTGGGYLYHRHHIKMRGPMLETSKEATRSHPQYAS